MSLATAAIDLVLDASLGAWLGVMTFFSFVGAPRAFAVFGDEAGEYVTDVFPRYYRIGVSLAVVALLASLARGAFLEFDAAGTTLLVVVAIALALAAYSAFGLVPKMEAAGEDAFATYHRVSVILNGATMLAVGMALLVAHLP